MSSSTGGDNSSLGSLVTITAPDAADALLSALLGGVDPEADPPRGRLAVEDGIMMYMPSTVEGACGIKVITTPAIGAARPGVPNVQGLYLLFDVATLRPLAILDGPSLTATRTAAASLLGLRLLDPMPDATALIVGTGAQARAHARALHADGVATRIALAGRSAASVDEAVRELRGEGVPADPVTLASVGSAQILVCATASTRPLFAADEVSEQAVVVAIGSHTTDARELEGALLGRSQVLVESHLSAMSEAGDVVQAIDEGHLREGELITLAGLARGEERVRHDRTRVFKTTGMAWEDLVVANAEYKRTSGEPATRVGSDLKET